MMSTLSPLNKLGVTIASYLIILLVLEAASSYLPNELLIYVLLPLVFLGPGALLTFVAVLVWQSRSQACWQRVWGLPLRGRWLCALVTTALSVTAGWTLLWGLFFTLANIWQATYPH